MGLIYKGSFKDNENNDYDIKIGLDSHSASPTDLTIKDCSIKYNNRGNIISKSCTVTIVNTLGFNDLDDMFRNYEQQYYLQVLKNDTYYMFDGWLICDVIEQALFDDAIISLTFTDYLLRLKDKEPSINIGDKVKLIDIIYDALSDTQLIGHDVYINSSLLHSGSTALSLYADTYLDAEVFFDNNYEKKSSYEVLETIMKSFNSYLYNYNGNWYIERYDDISSGAWVSYDGSTFTSIYDQNQTINKQLDFDYLNSSQTLSYNAGANTYELELNDKNYFTLLYNDFSNMTSLDTDAYSPVPVKGEWIRSDVDSTYSSTDIWRMDIPFRDIQNPVFMGVNPVNVTTWTNQAYTWDNDDYFNLDRGIMSSIDCTVGDIDNGEETQLDISFKYYLNKVFTDPSKLEDIYIYYSIRDKATGSYIRKNYDSGNWFYTGSTTNVQEHISVDTGNTYTTYDIDISIPLSQVNSIPTTGDISLVFGVYYAIYRYDGVIYIGDGQIVGDFKATLKQKLLDNNYLCTLNQGFIKKENDKIDLFDIENLNYKNGLYYKSGSSYYRTSKWSDDNGATYASLVDFLIKSRYKFLNKNTLNLNASIYYQGYLKPLAIVTDDNVQVDGQNLPMIINNYKLNLTNNQYKIDCTEYSEDSITLIYQ